MPSFMAQQAAQTRWPLNGIVLSIKAQLTTLLSGTHESSLLALNVTRSQWGRSIKKCLAYGFIPVKTYFYALKADTKQIPCRIFQQFHHNSFHIIFDVDATLMHS